MQFSFVYDKLQGFHSKFQKSLDRPMFIAATGLDMLPCFCKILIYGPAAEKRDLRTFGNSEDPDQPAHARSLVRIFAVHLHNRWTLLKRTDSEDLDPTRGYAMQTGLGPLHS